MNDKIIDLKKFINKVKSEFKISHTKINNIISCYKNASDSEKEIIKKSIDNVKKLKKELDNELDLLNNELSILIKIEELLND
jgi:hypothetical protein